MAARNTLKKSPLAKNKKKSLSPDSIKELQSLEVRGAREHNLRNVHVDIPKKKLVVFTGPSGSGKSSLAFDTIYAEGQRRYIESLSSYARQFLGQQDKPQYDSIRGLAPTIAIEQKAASKNPRSTVGTITEIHDYLRVLWARAGKQYCPESGEEVGKSSPDEIVSRILTLKEGSKILLLSPKVSQRKGEFVELFAAARSSGFTRVYVDGEQCSLDEDIQLEKNKKHDIAIIIDRLVIKESIRERLADSIEVALREGEGTARVLVLSSGKSIQEDLFFSEHLYCAASGRSFRELEPNSFSFNSPLGMCPDCNGLGTRSEVDPARVITDPSLSINEGAIAHFGVLGDEKRKGWHVQYRREILDKLGINRDKPWNKLSAKQRETVLFGANKRVKVNWSTKNGAGQFNSLFEGAIPSIQRIVRETTNESRKAKVASKYFSNTKCSTCNGHRLNQDSAAVILGGKSLPQVCEMTIEEAFDFFSKVKLTGAAKQIAEPVQREVLGRLRFLMNVGLSYLSLDRPGPTLSGGEAQRIRLASQVGSELTGVLYVLDEPSIGLHQRDNQRLIQTLKHLRDIGNSVLVVEHDQDTIEESDYVVDCGPRAGIAGGEVVFSGSVAGLKKCKDSLTGKYLVGKEAIHIPDERRSGNGEQLSIYGAAANNLRNIDVHFPLGTFTCLTGVSGAGKSSLLNSILYPALARHFHDSATPIGAHDKITGLDAIDRVIAIDQQPIGRTPRSNPATYTKVWDEIRALFSETRQAKMFGYKPGRFSFNVKGGRCEACEGDGVRKVEMHFLPDVYVQCETCHGRRFNEQTLRVTYKGKNIADVLEMSVLEAADLFSAHPKIKRILDTLIDVGLDYISLGQAATTLSGGEAQRIKLSRELAKRQTGRTLYILDEPSTGLHFDDIKKLLSVLQRLVDQGNSVIVIEHNLDIVKTADHIIDLGPEGGSGGGQLIAQGTPEEVCKIKKSATAEFLAPLLKKTSSKNKRVST